MLIAGIVLWIEPAEPPRLVVVVEARATGVPAADSCIVELMGDVNVSGSVNSADIIYLINWIFISGPVPEPCAGSGDINCNADITAADVILLVNYVFKSGPEPCDICMSESGQIWGCIQ